MDDASQPEDFSAALAEGSATLAAAETRRVTEKREETVARRRFQRGWIFKRGKKNPEWIGRYREDVIAADGKRRRRQCSVVLGLVAEIGYRQAQRKLNELLAEINQGTKKPTVLITFEQFVLEHFEPYILPTLGPGTARNYQSLIRHDLIPFFGEMRLSEIGPQDVQMFLTAKSKQVKAGTVLTLRNRLSKIFGTAQKWGYIPSNPAQGAQVPALTDTRERVALTPQQVGALLAELAEPFRTMILLAVLSGLRRGELFALRWKQVNFEEQSIAVAEAVYRGRLASPKTRASRRKVSVPAEVFEALSRIRPLGSGPEDFIFSSGCGTPLNPYNVLNREVLPACKRAGISRLSWHVFRYTYTTWAEATGEESLKAIQAQLGHTNPNLTLSVYDRLMPGAQRQVATKVGDVLHKVLLPVAPKLAAGEDNLEKGQTLIQ